jgi:competence protein ComEC
VKKYCLALSFLFLAGGFANGQITAHYINVGQADSILLEFRTAAILIDAGGEASQPEDRDRVHLIDYLNKFFAERAANSALPNLNRTLLAVIISHPHIDHTKNIMAVFENFKVQNLIDGGDDNGSGIKQLNAARKFAQDNHIRHAGIKDKMITTTNGLRPFPELLTSASRVDLRILDGSRGCDNENNDSLVVLARFRQAGFLFTGDAEVEGGSDCDGEVPILMEFYRNTNLLDIDVYKVGHHASFNGTNADFMRIMSPKISVISAGIRTQTGPGGFHALQFGHPRTVAVDLLEKFSSMTRKPVNVYSMPAVRTFAPRTMQKAVYCTCWDGDIKVSTEDANGSTLKVRTSGRPDGNGPIQ